MVGEGGAAVRSGDGGDGEDVEFAFSEVRRKISAVESALQAMLGIPILFNTLYTYHAVT